MRSTGTKFRTVTWVLAAAAVLFVAVQLFHAGPLSSLPFGTAHVETMGNAGPMGPEPHLW